MKTCSQPFDHDIAPSLHEDNIKLLMNIEGADIWMATEALEECNHDVHEAQERLLLLISGDTNHNGKSFQRQRI